ncbi:MAG: GTPase domain-containing protein [Planctomycetales bacterium]
MSTPELAQLEMLAQVDHLIDRLRQWIEPDSGWEPLEQSRALVQRLLSRVDSLRIRLEAPLVVATFGGTGTGKSALVNALVGQECTASGRQRPTTLRPVLICQPGIELEWLGLPADAVEVVRVDVPLLRDIVLIDCPDPDTTEGETAGSNLARLRQLLPYCDVLICASTQQKYRSARVADELAEAATGCRLVFVQTFADMDEDIRDDWQEQLAGGYQAPDLFFVDSLRALREQQAGLRPTGDFRRLQELLATELAASHRTQIRRANLVDLMHAALEHCRTHLDQHAPPLQRLSDGLSQAQQRLGTLMAQRLCEELLASRGLWERRLLGCVTDRWGISPFSLVLRTFNSLGSLMASAGLWRARSTAQMALVGALQGARWLTAKSQELQVEERLERVAALGLDDGVLRETQLIIAGYVQDARLDPRLVNPGDFEHLRNQAARVENRFLGDAGRNVEVVVQELAAKHSGWPVRIGYEALLAALLAYIVGWPGYSFFYAHPWLGKPLVPSDFYIHGAVYLLLWSGFLVMLFTRRLRRGLVDRITALARQMAESRMSAGLFPALERTLEQIRVQRERLEALSQSTAELRRDIAGRSALGSQITTVGPPRALQSDSVAVK